jgi:V-type H+-transporting ATPase subunit a
MEPVARDEPLLPEELSSAEDAPLGEGAWSVFRSEAMSPVRVCLPIDEEVATSTIRAIAATGMVQINDANLEMPESKRRFKDQLKTCIECLRFCRLLEEEVLKMDEESEVQLFERTIDSFDHYHDLRGPYDKLATWAKAVGQSNHAESDIIKNRNEYVEHASVLMHAGEFVNFAIEQSPRSLGRKAPGGEDMHDALIDLEADAGVAGDAMVHCVTGVCVTRTAESFSRALFRGLRGCVLMQLKHLEERIVDPVTGQLVYKSAFAAVCTGDASVEKVKHIATGYNAHLYECPTSQLDRERELEECVKELAEIDTVLEESRKAKLRILREFYQQCIPIKQFCLQERIVYHTLNMFQLTPEGNFLVADCWIPSSAEEEVKQALTDGSSHSAQRAFMEALAVAKHDTYPTFIRTNKFTAQFQAIVDTYGVPSYQEANPAFFAVAMFPFLFGVMFGDIVHGTLMLVFSLGLILYEDRISADSVGEIGAYLINGRYMILVMSVCAIYMGFIYNEAISLSLTLFGPSAFDNGPNHGEELPYPFGVDPIWRHSENNIQFTNSLKMKMSVIVGVAQMMVGIFLKLMNNIYFKRWLDVVVESIPELIFMSFTFGYMSLLVFRKWSIQYLPEPPDCFSSGCNGVIVGGYPLKAAPPMIITTMIKMFNAEAIDPQDQLYEGQNQMQLMLLLIAVGSLPILLLGKPLYLRRQANMASAAYDSLDGSSAADVEMEGYSAAPGEDIGYKEDTPDSPVGDAHEHEEFEFGEVFTHQAIHTIEFALGCVSNTASYLRLWALSLAHSQLSEVFYNYILHGYGLCLFGMYPGIAGGTAMIVFSYAGFFAATIGILMGMESLSAFLHALRLQWVEFQSKFYAAQGIAFKPLNLEEFQGSSL